MNIVLTRRQHIRASYAILACGLLAGSLSIGSAPISARVRVATHLEELRVTYAKSVAALAKSDAVRKQVDERAQEDISAALFQAETAALAGADLQNRMRLLIEAEGGAVVSSAFRQPPGDARPLTPVTVAVRLRCSVDALVSVLHELEGRQPVLFVEKLVIERRHRPERAMRDPNEELDVELDVTGYLDGRVKS